MRITRKDQITTPFRAPLGEEIFELIGRPVELGGTVKHSLAYVVVPPGFGSPAHYHKESEETYYIVDGEARLRVDGEEHYVVAGDACLIVPRAVHQIVSVGTGDLEFLVISAPAWTPTDTYAVPQ
jgi:mannose-6-phosphate isomerase-like protein (cupin superfamily)